MITNQLLGDDSEGYRLLVSVLCILWSIVYLKIGCEEIAFVRVVGLGMGVEVYVYE